MANTVVSIDSRKRSSENSLVLYKGEVVPDEHFGSFSIVSRVYEGALDKKYGVVLSEVRNGCKTNFNGDLENNVFFRGGFDHPREMVQKKILEKYVGHPGFCSMKVDSETDLINYIKNVHELSYNHYVWAKEENMKRMFPDFCCGYSTVNLALTLMERGCANVVGLANIRCDHDYVCLPFVMSEKRGLIIVDPTSDQLFNDKFHAPRNHIFVSFGPRWFYETDWKGGKDLYPSFEDKSRFMNLHTLRKGEGSVLFLEDVQSCLQKCFENVVEVTSGEI
jgi:hypothetical protein